MQCIFCKVKYSKISLDIFDNMSYLQYHWIFKTLAVEKIKEYRLQTECDVYIKYHLIFLILPMSLKI